MNSGKRGRPRNLETQQAILQAAYDLLFEIGFADITVEKIAERAGVSKATIYKWWPGKAAVVMDGYLSAASQRMPVPDTGFVFDDLLAHATNLTRFLASAEGRVITELIGAGQTDAGVAEAFRSRYVQPRRKETRQIIDRGIQRGELRLDVNPDLFIDLLYGPIFYRLTMTGEELDDDFIKNIVSLTFQGIAQAKP
ncbi:TetR/AcrR family transcriptional regulator [Paenibacillus whitsoniae]|uniref:TetR/AcrR family transcriptional regulator n=1 Tax=Paenibacillus whitsoniae TaxID=2496558 RepID=A0A430J942_9BACL|nr:TetR/AcrR family transcriptional regulator [Paenibacillus whitsoniae]RTE07013.1 TetR/AcrR family transcriptional regulator [Paenibacillus whitsoniae]